MSKIYIIELESAGMYRDKTRYLCDNKSRALTEVVNLMNDPDYTVSKVIELDTVTLRAREMVLTLNGFKTELEYMPQKGEEQR